MSYQIAYTPVVKRQIDSLPGHIKSLARQEIAALSCNPRPARSKELEGHPNHFRLWLGRRYRLVWRVVEADQVVELKYVGFKPPNLYERLGLERPID
jgi:mRNA-degrading endonuclease RelE of RelBE toxin-antitoxin system